MEKIYQRRKGHKSVKSLTPIEFCIKMAATSIKMIVTCEILIYVISAVGIVELTKLTNITIGTG